MVVLMYADLKTNRRLKIFLLTSVDPQRRVPVAGRSLNRTSHKKEELFLSGFSGHCFLYRWLHVSGGGIEKRQQQGWEREGEYRHVHLSCFQWRRQPSPPRRRVHQGEQPVCIIAWCVCLESKTDRAERLLTSRCFPTKLHETGDALRVEKQAKRVER